MTEVAHERNVDWQSGLFALLAIFFLAAAWVWLKGIPLFHPVQKFSVRWHDIDGLNLNAAVKISGVQVGSVESIELESKDNVVVGVNINKRVQVPQNAKMSILSYGLVGAKFVDITLPDVQPNEPQPRPLAATDVIQGIDPTRTELVADKLAKSLDKVDLDQINVLLTTDMRKISRVSDDVSVLSHKLDGVSDKALVMADKFGLLAQDLRTTSRNLNKVIGDPQVAANLRQTARSIESTVHQLNETLADKDMRTDLKESLSSLNQSTEHIENSVGTLQQLSSNDKLRTDMKQILDKTDNVVTKINTLVTSPNVNPQVKTTLLQTQDAVQHLDLAARQVNQILDNKRPLLKLLFGRPGHLHPQKHQERLPEQQAAKNSGVN